MIAKCEVKDCDEYSCVLVKIGRNELGVCGEHIERSRALMKKFDEEVLSLKWKYLYKITDSD